MDKSAQDDLDAVFRMAVRNGSIDDVQKLLDMGASVHARDTMGWTGFIYAVRGGKREMAEFLLAQGSDINAGDMRGDTALHLTAIHNLPEMTQTLLDWGADINALNSDDVCTAVFYATDHPPVLRILLEAGADINLQDKKGRTPLIRASEHKHEEAVRLLLEKNPGLEVKDEDTCTALAHAVINRSDRIIRLLAEAGANLRPVHNEALLRAARQNDFVGVEEALDKGADIDAKDPDISWTALMWAAHHGNNGMAQLLIARGCDREAVSPRDKNNALLLAAKNGKEGVIKVLLEAGVNTDVRNEFGMTALYLVIKNLPAIDLLLKAGADVNLSDQHKNTPLMSAAGMKGNEKAVAALLAAGANPELENDMHNTAFMFAIINQCAECMRALEEGGADMDNRWAAMEALAGRRGMRKVLLKIKEDRRVKDLEKEVRVFREGLPYPIKATKPFKLKRGM